MAKLIIETGRLAGKQLVIPTKEMLIGRDEGCFIRMGSPDISRKHCSLRATPEGIRVADLGSSNGTWVNDVKIVEPTILNSGDLLRVGPASFRVDGPKPEPIPDADIADWLADLDSKTGMNSGEDTAIYKAVPDTAAVATPVAPGPRPLNSPRLARTKRVFKSVAEEAQYVIALYQELKALEEELGSGQ